MFKKRILRVVLVALPLIGLAKFLRFRAWKIAEESQGGWARCRQRRHGANFAHREEPVEMKIQQA